jgi:nitrite reductase/ring-hydroxylating ferredoxin subunit
MHKKTPAPLASASFSRRAFLRLAFRSFLALGSLLGLGGLLRFLGHQPNPDLPTEFDLGPPESYAEGSRTVIPEAQAVLQNTRGVFTAYSLVCPHLGCQAESLSEGFACPCHGSQFGPHGELRRGPAEQPLRQLALKLAPNGHMILSTKNTG